MNRKNMERRVRRLERLDKVYAEVALYAAEDDGMAQKLAEIIDKCVHEKLNEDVSAMEDAHRRNTILILVGFFLISLHGIFSLVYSLRKS